MDSLIFAVNAVSPIIVTVAVGYLLKKAGLMSADFAKAANKLVFRLLLPSMLFLNVYKIENIASMDFGYVLYVLIALITIFALSIPLCLAVSGKGERRGVLLQGIFRSNYALVGIPLAQSLFGDEGAIIATLLSAFYVPALNMLAVISLSIFKKNGSKPDVKKILLGIVKNPLIQSIALAIVFLGIRAIFENLGIEFRISQIPAIFTPLEYFSRSATPIALLVLGAQFEFSAIKELRREIIFGTFMRTFVVPLLGLGVAYLFFSDTFTGAHFAAFVAVFATPVAVSSVPMAQEMEGDSALAGQLVVWTTLFSALSVFLASFLLKLAGIFA